jgi:hypothetical protein
MCRAAPDHQQPARYKHDQWQAGVDEKRPKPQRGMKQATERPGTARQRTAAPRPSKVVIIPAQVTAPPREVHRVRTNGETRTWKTIRTD